MNSTAKPMASGPAAGVRRSISIGFTMVATALVTTLVLQWRSHYLAERRLDSLRVRTASVMLRSDRSFDEAWNRAEHRIRQWDRAADAALEDSSAESLRRRHLTAHQSAAERSMSAMLTAANRAEGELANLWEEAIVAGLDADELDYLQEVQSEWIDRARTLQDRFETVEFVFPLFQERATDTSTPSPIGRTSSSRPPPTPAPSAATPTARAACSFPGKRSSNRFGFRCDSSTGPSSASSILA